MIALDTTALSALFIPGAKLWRAGTNTPIKYGKERLEALVERIAKERDTILIPTPVLSELLVCISPDNITDLLAQLNASIWFRVEAFDSAAAVELGVRTARAITAGDKREGAPADTPWTKVKFDRQIVAIAIVNGASEIISDDPHVKALGERWGIKVTSVDDLPIPEELVPPPLWAALEDDANEEKPGSGTLVVSGSDDGHPENQAGVDTADEKAGDKEAGSE
jgi:predicted nucleic acid-binding protein